MTPAPPRAFIPCGICLLPFPRHCGIERRAQPELYQPQPLAKGFIPSLGVTVTRAFLLFQ